MRLEGVRRDSTIRFELGTTVDVGGFFLRFEGAHPDLSHPPAEWGAVKEDNMMFAATPRTKWMQTLEHSVPYTPNQNLDSTTNGPYPTECVPQYDEIELPNRNQ